jgi:predicted CxxxxCH...CXXCH cytochrome family protein
MLGTIGTCSEHRCHARGAAREDRANDYAAMG